MCNYRQYSKFGLFQDFSVKFTLRRDEGLDLMKFSVYLLMSCLCIHLVTLFNLACKKKIVMDFFFLCRKISFFHHHSVYFGEITRVMRHICIFSRDIFSPPIFS